MLLTRPSAPIAARVLAFAPPKPSSRRKPISRPDYSGRRPRHSCILILLFVCVCVPLAAQYPEIQNLSIFDITFKQYTQDVQENLVRLARGTRLQELAENLSFYTYTIQAGEDLFSLAARCSIPWESISSLNRSGRTTRLQVGSSIILPTMPGLFIPETPADEIEYLLAGARRDAEAISIQVRGTDSSVSRFDFLPNETLSSTERAFFLNNSFRFPLPFGRVTSSFGMRKNPFTGNHRFHQGIDLAAPTNTAVYAARSGTVIFIGYNEIYGNYMIIEHEGGWQTLYGHLHSFETHLRNNVQSGSIIARVGSTGQSTGPHLHFEIRRHGTAVDPARLLPEGTQ